MGASSEKYGKSDNKEIDAAVSRFVGIGASAGGLEAIEAFFKHMPTDTGLTFIVIQHLSPDYKSLMVELLSKKTTMPVLRAEDGMLVEPNHIYLIPPKKNLTIFHGKLLLHDQLQGQGINLPIDIFLRSLAEDQGEKAVAIILSGTGSDGTRGVRAVKELNGLVLVQDEDSAKFDGMPRAAISTGLADFVLPPDKMPEQLLACVKHPLGQLQDRKKRLLDDEDSRTRIFSELRNTTKVDFTYYKPSTINRRIERRITVCQVKDIDEYVRYILVNPRELMILYRELLIGVTSFFRDPEAWKMLAETYLPPLLTRDGNRELRFWTTACSTGEEAYTLAIVVKEVMEKMGVSRDIKIFATDLDREAIIKAGSGLYPESIAADLEPGLLSKYFYKKGENYQIARHIREMVVFAPHNLIKDPPFTKIDLVTCRNLLIYLQPVLQHKALSMFNFSLNQQGLLFLGSSETVGDMNEYFITLHPKYKIYEALGKNQNDGTGKIATSMIKSRRNPLQQDSYGTDSFQRRVGNEEFMIVNRLLETLQEQFVPLTVVVNEQLEILYTMGNSEGIFRIPAGRANFDISKMVSKELSVPLTTGIQKVFRTQEPLIYNNIRLHYMEEIRIIKMHIIPLPDQKGQMPLAAVFLEVEKPKITGENNTPVEVFDITEQTRQQIADMELELQFTRENLQATIEELETSNEELQATNEELLASNEELQSTNEELQSTNEELYTVNSEYQNKIIELTELNNDVDNLLTGSKIGTLLLDEDMQIRRFSPEVSKIFKILDKDIGRPISHLAHQIEEFNLIEAIKSVQTEEKVFEKDVLTAQGTSYLIRILPYHIGPRTFSGVVITFVDITQIRKNEKDLKSSRQFSQDMVKSISSGLFLCTQNELGELIIESINPEAEKLTDKLSIDWAGKSFSAFWPWASESGLLQQLQQVLQTGEVFKTEDIRYDSQGNVEKGFRIQAFIIPEKRLAISFEDITDFLKSQESVRKNEELYRNLFETMAEGVVYQSSSGEILSVNKAAEQILGRSLMQIAGKTSSDPVWITIDEEGNAVEAEKYPSMVALRTGKTVTDFIMGVWNPRKNSFVWILINAEPQFRDGESTPYQVFTTFTDISKHIESEKALRKAHERLDFAFKTTGMAWWEWNPVTNIVTVSEQKAAMAGFTPEEVDTKLDFWTARIHPDDYEETMTAMREHLAGKREHYRAQYRLQKKDGTYITFLDQGQIIERAANGKAARIVGTVKEIKD